MNQTLAVGLALALSAAGAAALADETIGIVQRHLAALADALRAIDPAR